MKIILIGICISTLVFMGCNTCDEELPISKLGNSNCEELLKSYEDCRCGTISVFQSGNCDKRYSSLISKVCYE